jgi:hypothetical protein
VLVDKKHVNADRGRVEKGLYSINLTQASIYSPSVKNQEFQGNFFLAENEFGVKVREKGRCDESLRLQLVYDWYKESNGGQ